MKPINQVVRILANLILICGIIMVGCQVFEQKESPVPTTPGVASGLANYWGQEGVEEGMIKVYVGDDGKSLLSVNVPPGSYRLWYLVHDPNGSPHALHIDFEAIEKATLCIGLNDGNTLQKAVIAIMTFRGAPIHEQGPLRLYAFPGGWLGWARMLSIGQTNLEPPDGTTLYPPPAAPTMPNRCSAPQSISTTSTSTSTSTSTTSTTTTTTTTGTISGNSAIGNWGGGIFNNTTANFGPSNLIQNNIAANGGGVYNNLGTLSVPPPARNYGTGNTPNNCVGFGCP